MSLCIICYVVLFEIRLILIYVPKHTIYMYYGLKISHHCTSMFMDYQFVHTSSIMMDRVLNKMIKKRANAMEHLAPTVMIHR